MAAQPIAYTLIYNVSLGILIQFGMKKELFVV